jgi:cobalt-zinc-cadmium efflux system membrane fusion protein
MNPARVRRLLPATAGAIALLVALACGRSPGGAGSPHEDEHGHAADEHAEEGGGHAGQGPEEARFDLAGVRGVAFGPVGEPREEGAWFPAEAVAETSAAAAVTTPVGGIVAALLAEPGQVVARGEALVEVTSPEVADLRADWLLARARRVRAESEVRRERRLLAAAATSEREAEAAEAEAAEAAAAEEAARLALEGRGLDPQRPGTKLLVRAPRAGILASFAVALGEGVDAGQELGRLVAPGARHAQVELPLPGPAAWEPGAETEARHSDGRAWRARVVGVPAALSNETRRLTYRLRLEGEALPFAGTPLEVRVPLARAVILPQGAVQQIEGTWGVFVREGEAASFRPVRKGPELGADVLVLSGVAPGESVALEGAYLLKSLYLKQAGGGDAHDH